MARLVMKFGGVSVADGRRLRNVGELVRGFSSGNEIVVVTSALQGVTDDLLECARSSAKYGRVSDVDDFIMRLAEKHEQAITDAISDEAIRDEIRSDIRKKIDTLEKAYVGICYLGELTPRSIDYISSFGEQLSAPILSGVFRDMGIESRYYTGGEVGIITNSDYGNAKPLEKSYSLIAKKLLPIKGIPVVTGFIAMDENGIITTLGRGGSDFSASIIGAAIDADEIWFWKETSGVLTADPKIDPSAKTIPTISYIEAMELSFFGAKVLHPRAIEPAIRKGIPVRVKCTFDPESPGTQIVQEEELKDGVIKAVSLSTNVALLNVSGAEMIGTPGVAARVFSALANAGVNIIMISQGSSEANISMVVEEKDLDKAEEALRRDLPREIVRGISHNKDVCVVAVVGSGMAGTPGVAGRLFSAMGRAGINVRMISQGSSEHNISFVVAAKDGKRAVQEIHREFRLNGDRA
ncbi:aspartate kinase [Methanothrix sp.]|uniref:aspartate kinase n=1 Tax=Methanothrix sp. TaxID=90426 RepID=UPI002580B698|nr:aspartate kinase [Methanothrix sp.]NPU86852.1 aspartate kinase [Methanothrix sp.]